jgi:hypothetical protein
MTSGMVMRHASPARSRTCACGRPWRRRWSACLSRLWATVTGTPRAIVLGEVPGRLEPRREGPGRGGADPAGPRAPDRGAPTPRRRRGGPRMTTSEEAHGGDRVSRGAAPDIERAHPPGLPPSLAFGESQQDGVRCRLREPGDHLRRTPSRAGRRIHGTSGANHREPGARGQERHDHAQGTRTTLPMFLRAWMYAWAAGASAKLNARSTCGRTFPSPNQLRIWSSHPASISRWSHM